MRILTVIILLLLQNLAFSQSISRFQLELNSLDSLLRNTNSFKQQISGDRLQLYQQKKAEIGALADTAHAWQRFLQLTGLLDMVRDNHLGFYQSVDYKLFTSKAGIDSLYASDYFQHYPVINWNLDSLKQELSKKAIDAIEGIFHYGKYYTMGIVKTVSERYMGVVLDSKIPYVKQGQIIAWLNVKSRGRYSAVYLHPLTHTLIYYPTESFSNQQLLYSKFYQSYYNGNYTKTPDEADYTNLPDTAAQFLISETIPEVRYVRVGSFSNNGPLRKQSDSLLQQLKISRVLPYTIFDLRNNTGGSSGMSKPYIKWIKQLSKKSRVVVLINANTISQGEITANKLSKVKGVLLAGQQTKGMLAYGSNYGKHIPLTGGEFTMYPTDMPNRGLLKFEDVGIAPELVLSNQQDWLKQIYQYWKLPHHTGK